MKASFNLRSRHSLSILLQLAVHPAVPLVGDEQRNDVALVEAEQRVVVAGGVGEDGAHARPLHDVVEARGDGHGPGEAAVVAVGELCERQEEEEEAERKTMTGMAGCLLRLFILTECLQLMSDNCGKRQFATDATGN